MAFQDNSGDIILDVVLTDEGRRRLAAGGGAAAFSITKFALGDDEINYELFDTSKSTALQDLSILQTPILEAFTNNTATMRSKLITPNLSQAAMMGLLYLPVIKLNTLSNNHAMDNTSTGTLDGNSNAFIVTADQNTFQNTAGTSLGIVGPAAGPMTGFRQGVMSDHANSENYIRVDTGYDTSDVNATNTSLSETDFLIRMDDRLLKLRDFEGAVTANTGVVDDDNIRTYESTGLTITGNATPTQSSPLAQIGRVLRFKVIANTDLASSNYLFDRLGGTGSKINQLGNTTGTASVKYIDTMINVSGMTLGFSIDIPVRILKL
tara:strand:+ start:893 stop:1858 length:966 start_codon:yes stop_codon:yes gene_type:complete